jgi:hypothetical protein
MDKGTATATADENTAIEAIPDMHSGDTAVESAVVKATLNTGCGDKYTAVAATDESATVEVSPDSCVPSILTTGSDNQEVRVSDPAGSGGPTEVASPVQEHDVWLEPVRGHMECVDAGGYGRSIRMHLLRMNGNDFAGNVQIHIFLLNWGHGVSTMHCI